MKTPEAVKGRAGLSLVIYIIWTSDPSSIRSATEVKRLLLGTLFVLVPSLGLGNDEVVERALSYIGVPYRFAGYSETGLDCAGLIHRTYADLGIEVPRTAAALFRKGEDVDPDSLEPGDLVFFRNTYKRGISHVGIYIGDGQFVHAASSPRRVVVDNLDLNYFTRRFAGARRIGTESTAPSITPCTDDVLSVTPCAEPETITTAASRNTKGMLAHASFLSCLSE